MHHNPNEPSPENKRKLQRVDITQAVIVKDFVRNLEVGRLVNVHEEGFMLLGGHDVRVDCLYQLSFHFSDGSSTIDQLSVGAECLWIRETDTCDQYWAGFHIIDISDHDRQFIRDLIKHIQNHDSH